MLFSVTNAYTFKYFIAFLGLAYNFLVHWCMHSSTRVCVHRIGRRHSPASTCIRLCLHKAILTPAALDDMNQKSKEPSSILWMNFAMDLVFAIDLFTTPPPHTCHSMTALSRLKYRICISLWAGSCCHTRRGNRVYCNTVNLC